MDNLGVFNLKLLLLSTPLPVPIICDYYILQIRLLTEATIMPDRPLISNSLCVSFSYCWLKKLKGIQY